jgi:hypothetical protein
LEGAYQSAEELDEVLPDANELLEITDELVAAAEAADASPGGLAAVGLLNGADDAAYDDAVAAFAAGDAEGVAAASARTQQIVDDAAGRGAAAATAAVLAIAVALFALRTHRSGGRNRRAPDEIRPLNGGVQPVVASR